MKINEFLDAMASVDEKYTSASESAFYGYGKKDNATVNRRRLASASATVLLLSVSLAAGLITASLFGVLPETVFGGHGAASSEQAMTIELNECVRDLSIVGAHSGRMSEEDSRTVLEIWDKYKHEKGVFDNISDVYFRVEEDYDKGNFEWFEYDSRDGLMQYRKIVNAYDKKNRKSTGGTYAVISGEDKAVLEAIAEKYRSELVYWTLSVGGEEYRMSDEDRRAFSKAWTYLSRQIVTKDSSGEEDLELSGSTGETCTITVNNSSLPTFFRYYEDTGRIEYCYSDKSFEGEISDYSESRFAGDLKPTIDEIIRKYRGGASQGAEANSAPAVFEFPDGNFDPETLPFPLPSESVSATDNTNYFYCTLGSEEEWDGWVNKMREKRFSAVTHENSAFFQNTSKKCAVFAGRLFDTLTVRITWYRESVFASASYLPDVKSLLIPENSLSSIQVEPIELTPGSLYVRNGCRVFMVPVYNPDRQPESVRDNPAEKYYSDSYVLVFKDKSYVFFSSCGIGVADLNGDGSDEVLFMTAGPTSGVYSIVLNVLDTKKNALSSTVLHAMDDKFVIKGGRLVLETYYKSGEDEKGYFDITIDGDGTVNTKLCE